MEKELPPHSVTVGIDIRTVTLHLPSGDQPGYQLRFEIQSASQEATIWSGWYFLTEEGLEGMVKKVSHFASTLGHLAPQNVPGSTLQ